MRLFLLGFIISISVSAAELKVKIGPLLVDPETNQLGQLRFRICDNEKCHKADGEAPHYYLQDTDKDLLSKLVLEDRVKEASVVFNLPPGEYSLFVHHDRNMDNKVKSKTCGIFGKPKDGISFSQNIDPRDNWGSPTWKQSNFVLPAEGIEIVVHPIYMCD